MSLIYVTTHELNYASTVNQSCIVNACCGQMEQKRERYQPVEKVAITAFVPFGCRSVAILRSMLETRAV